MATKLTQQAVLAEQGLLAQQKRRSATADVVTDLGDFFITDVERQQIYESDVQAVMQAPVKTLDLLAFKAGDEDYGISIAYIQEIVKLPPITTVPKTPPQVLGIISLRGTIVPVVDLRIVLGVTRSALQRTARLLVLRNEAQPLALLVDAVSQVVRLDRSNIEPRPEGAVSRNNRYIESIGRIGPRMLIVLDPPALLSVLELAQ